MSLFEMYDIDTGRLVLSAEQVAGRAIVYQYISGPGSITNSRLSQGTPFWLFLPSEYSTLLTTPTITFAGDTATWSGAATGYLLIGVT